MIHISSELERPRQLRIMAKLEELGIAYKVADLDASDDIKQDSNPDNHMTEEELTFLWQIIIDTQSPDGQTEGDA